MTKKYGLNEFSQIAEIIAAVGVIVSLIYVGSELQENSAAVRAQTSQALIDSSREFVLDIALSEELSEIRQKGEADLSSLTEVEERRFFGILTGNWLYFQNAWIQWTLGVVDDRIWNSYRSILCGSLEAPGNLEMFKRLDGVMDAEFVAYVYECADL